MVEALRTASRCAGALTRPGLRRSSRHPRRQRTAPARVTYLAKARQARRTRSSRVDEIALVRHDSSARYHLGTTLGGWQRIVEGRDRPRGGGGDAEGGRGEALVLVVDGRHLVVRAPMTRSGVLMAMIDLYTGPTKVGTWEGIWTGLPVMSQGWWDR